MVSENSRGYMGPEGSKYSNNYAINRIRKFISTPIPTKNEFLEDHGLVRDRIFEHKNQANHK